MTNRFVVADICGGDFMRKFILVWGLLCAVAFPCYAQNWTSQDSLRLNRLLKGEEVENLAVIRSLLLFLNDAQWLVCSFGIFFLGQHIHFKHAFENFISFL